MIVNSLRALDGAVPQGCPEPRRRPQSAQKISLVLDKAPKHLQPDLVALVPKLVEHSEHPLAADVLIERLQAPDAETALRIPVRWLKKDFHSSYFNRTWGLFLVLLLQNRRDPEH